MKKKFSFIFCLLLGVSIFAEGSFLSDENWIGNYNIGLSIPIFSTSFESNSSVNSDAKGNGVNFYFNAQSIHKHTGFLFEAGLGAGGLKAKDFYNSDDEWGFNFLGKIGLGYAFVHSKKAVISLTGVIGLDWSLFDKDYDMTVYDSTYTMTAEVMPWVFFAGAELSGTIRLSERVGIFGSCLFAIPFAGWEGVKVSYNGISSSASYDLNSGGYFIQPAFGLSITVD